jgi:thioredoxin-like negative regulator of GroEL
MKKLVCSLMLLACLYQTKAQQAFPSVTIKSVNGSDVDFSALINQTKDTAIIVSFWATWCMPCNQELDNINDQYKERQADKPFKLLAISIDDARTVQRVKPFVKGKGWLFDVYLDQNNDLKRALNVNDVPQVIVIKNNKVVYQHTGYVTGNEDEMFDKIKSL